MQKTNREMQNVKFAIANKNTFRNRKSESEPTIPGSETG